VLREIKDIQKRVDKVSEDFESGESTFAEIDAWKLGELLGLDWNDTADWSRSFWAFRTEIDEDEFKMPLAENVSLLESEIPKARYKFLMAKSAQILNGDHKLDLPLTKKEEKILRDAYARNCASESHFMLAETSVHSTAGEELYFQVCIGDGGEPFNACSPYDLASGGGCDLGDFVEV